MKKFIYKKNFALGLLSFLFIGSINSQTTDQYRIWAKDANVLFDYYHWAYPIGVAQNGSSNFNIPSDYLIPSVTSGVNYAWNNCFLKFENVDFGTLSDSLTFVRNVPRGATIEFWIDRDETTRYDSFFREGSSSDQSAPGNVTELSGGKFLGSYQHWYIYTNDPTRWEKIKIGINPTGGKHTLYVLFRVGGKSRPRQYLGGLYYIDLQRTLGTEVTTITSNETTLQLPIGKHALQYTYEPSNAATSDLVWTVENESEKGILTVNNGTVIAIKPGTAKVKCVSSRASGDVSLTYNITVVGTSTASNLRIEAESADTLYNTYRANGAQAFEKVDFQEKGLENNGNKGLAYAWNTNFAIYKNVDFGSFTDSIRFYHADIRGAAVEFWLDREIIKERHPARVTDPTNDYNNVSGKELAGGVFLGRYDFLHDEKFRSGNQWAKFALPIVPASGVHDLYVVFLQGGKESDMNSDAVTTYNKTVGHWDWFELDRKIANIYQIIPSEKTVTMRPGDTKTISLQIVPEIVYNNSVTWSVIQGSEYVSVDNAGNITANAIGTAKVRVTSNADSNVYTDIDVTVDISTGISETNLSLTYTNPVSDILSIHSNATIQDILITDSFGRIVYKKSKANTAEFNLNCSTWSTGLYVVQIKTASETKVLKITK